MISLKEFIINESVYKFSKTEKGKSCSKYFKSIKTFGDAIRFYVGVKNNYNYSRLLVYRDIEKNINEFIDYTWNNNPNDTNPNSIVSYYHGTDYYNYIKTKEEYKKFLLDHKDDKVLKNKKEDTYTGAIDLGFTIDGWKDTVWFTLSERLLEV